MRVFFLLCLCFCSFPVFSQECQLELNTPDDITICQPALIPLNGSITGPYYAFEWTSDQGYFNNQNLNPQVPVNTTTTFTLKAFGESHENLIQNPSFENGNSGFSTLYTYNPVSLWNEGTYSVNSNPNSVHSGFAACSAHEGTQMMVLNGSVSLARIWCQTVNVTPNTNYVFWAWATSVNASNPARLQFSINNGLIGQQFNLVGTTCLWQQFYAVWNSGNNTTADICIVNQNTQPSGNDFAIDDLFFGPLCEEEKEFTVTLEEFDILPLEIPPITCFDTEQVITAYTDPPMNGLTYHWETTNGTINSNPDNQEIFVSSAGTYTVTVTSENLCSRTESFEVTADNLPPDVAIVGNNLLDCNALASYIEAFVYGNTDVTYEWSFPDLTSFSGQGFYATSPGRYIVTAYGQNGCSDTASINIVLENVSFSYIKHNKGPLTCRQDSAAVYIENNSNIDRIIWTTPPYENLPETFDTLWIHTPGTYHFILEEGSFCTLKDSIVVETLPAIHSYRKTIPDTLTCLNPEVLIQLSDLTNVDSLIWSLDNDYVTSNDSFTVTLPGLYLLTALDSNGCKKIDSVFVFENKSIPEVMVAIDSITCVDNLGGFTLTVSNPVTIHWQGLYEQSDLANPKFSDEGLYHVTVTGENGCSFEESYFLPSSKNYPDISVEVLPITCLNPTGSIQLTTSVPASITWTGPNNTFGNTNQILSTQTGNFIIKAETPQGCIKEKIVELPVDTIRPNLQMKITDTLTCIKTKVSGEVYVADYDSLFWSGSGPFDKNVLEPEFTNGGVFVLTLVNDNGCSVSQFLTVSVDTLRPVFTAVVNDISCAFPVTSLELNSVYQPKYSIGNQNIISGHTISQPGEYVIEAMGENGCTHFETVWVHGFFEKHEIKLEPAHLNCFTPSLWIKDLFYQDSIKYSWITNNNTTQTDSMLISGGLDNIRLLAENGYGCISETSVTITEDFKLPQVAVTGSLEIDCRESFTRLVANSSDADVVFTWQNGSGNQPEINIFQPGDYKIFVFSTANGCSDSLSIPVSKEPSPENLNFDLSLPVCAEDPASVTIGFVTGGTAPYTYFLDNKQITEQIPHILQDKKRYDVKVLDDNDCPLDTFFEIMPLLPLTIEAGKDTTILLGQSVTLHPSSSHEWDQLSSVFWDPGESVSCTDCPYPTTSAEISTLYTLYITDDHGCVKEDSVWVRVRRINGYDAPNIILPLSASGNNRFTLYERFHSIEVIEKLAIYDRWGNEVFQKINFPPGDETSGWNGTFGEQPVAAGIYVWVARIVYKNGETEMAAGDVMVGY